MDPRDLNAFVRQLISLGRQRGMALSHPAETVAASPREGVEVLLGRVAAAYARGGAPLDLIFCVMPDTRNQAYLYPAIKRWAHTSGGVPSQCVCVSKLMDRQKYAPIIPCLT